MLMRAQVSQYLSDDFLCEMGALPDFGLEEILPPPVSLQVHSHHPHAESLPLQVAEGHLDHVLVGPITLQMLPVSA